MHRRTPTCRSRRAWARWRAGERGKVRHLGSSRSTPTRCGRPPPCTRSPRCRASGRCSRAGWRRASSPPRASWRSASCRTRRSAAAAVRRAHEHRRAVDDDCAGATRAGRARTWSTTWRWCSGCGGCGEQLGATPAQVAIAWVLAKGDDVVPIPGTKRLRYLEENVAAADLALERGRDRRAGLAGRGGGATAYGRSRALNPAQVSDSSRVRPPWWPRKRRSWLGNAASQAMRPGAGRTQTSARRAAAPGRRPGRASRARRTSARSPSRARSSRDHVLGLVDVQEAVAGRAGRPQRAALAGRASGGRAARARSRRARRGAPGSTSTWPWSAVTSSGPACAASASSAWTIAASNSGLDGPWRWPAKSIASQ